MPKRSHAAFESDLRAPGDPGASEKENDMDIDGSGAEVSVPTFDVSFDAETFNSLVPSTADSGEVQKTIKMPGNYSVGTGKASVSVVLEFSCQSANRGIGSVSCYVKDDQGYQVISSHTAFREDDDFGGGPLRPEQENVVAPQWDTPNNREMAQEKYNNYVTSLLNPDSELHKDVEKELERRKA